MAFMKGSSGEPLTPMGRLFFQEEFNHVVHLALGMKNPIDVESLKASVKSSIMVNNPRFCSLLVRDRRGVERWRRTKVDIDRHFVIVEEPVNGSGDDEDAVNEYLAELAVPSGPSINQPLWEIHALLAHNCLVFRVHHSLGDGTSFLSMLLAMCRKADSPSHLPTVPHSKRRHEDGSFWRKALKLLQLVWFSIIFGIGFALRSTLMWDRKSPISGGNGVELWPRKCATARFSLDDMKRAKRAVPNATINDVLFSCLSIGLHRYMNVKWPNAMHTGHRFTGLSVVNIRENPGLQEYSSMLTKNPRSGWGNRFGVYLTPLYHCKYTDPLEHLRKAEKMFSRRKKSLVAHLTYWFNDILMSYFGSAMSSFFCKMLFCNTTFMLSNMVGPLEEITYLGNPITYVRVTSSGLPHALTMHMVSYADRADLQILVAKDLIPDPEFLAKCFEEALIEIKLAADASLRIDLSMLP